MYKSKLKEQLSLLEERQKMCDGTETAGFLALCKEILAIAKKIDELDNKPE